MVGRRLGSTAAGAVVAAALGVAAVACGGPAPSGAGPAASPEPPSSAPSTVTGQRDGVLVTLAASATRLAAGERLDLVVSALNIGLDPVTYMSGGCGPIGSLVVGPPGEPGPGAGAPPQGEGWEAALLLARWAALSDNPTAVASVQLPGSPEGAPMACTAELDFDDLAPGEAWSGTASWAAITFARTPAPGGAYTVSWEFPFVARGPTEALPLDPATRAIPILLPVVVDPVPGPAVGPRDALDSGAADPRVRAWAQRTGLSRLTLTGSDIRLDGATWRWRIGLEGGDAIVRIDAATGEVVGIPD